MSKKITFKSSAAPVAALTAASLAITAVIFVLTPDYINEQIKLVLANPFVVAAEFLPIALALALVYFIFGRVWVATTAVSLFVFLFSGVNRYKVFLRGDPLMPSDFILGGEALSISSASSIKIGVGVIALLALIVVSNALFALFVKFVKKPGAIVRAIGAAATIALMAAAYFFVYQKDAVYDSVPVNGNQYNMVNEYNSKGVLLAFLYHTKDLYISKPVGYSDELARNILSRYENADNIEDYAVEGEAPHSFRPDIIMLMSEAFWDITEVPSLEFENDPIPTFHRLQNEAATGELYASVFGGGTDTTEFSVLTGHTVSNYEQNISSAYKFLVRGEIDSIPKTLKRSGYDTLAVHPGYGWFYNRRNVYEWMGFDRFLTVDDFDPAGVSGNYISDEAFADVLIDEYDRRSADGGAPLFVFSVSIQNHGPYDAGYMYGQDMERNYALIPGREPLSEKANYAVVNYVRGIEDADKSLARLVERLDKSERPAVLLFFGDHLPLLCNSFGAYRELDYPIGQEYGMEGIANEYRVRYVIYANAAARDAWPRYGDSLAGTSRRMSANYLGAYLLSEIGIDTSAYEKMVRDLLDVIPVREPLFCGVGSEDGAPLESEAPESALEKLREYGIVQHYMISGAGGQKGRLSR